MCNKVDRIKDFWLIANKFTNAGFSRVLRTDPLSMLHHHRNFENDSNKEGVMFPSHSIRSDSSIHRLMYDSSQKHFIFRYTVPEDACLTRRNRFASTNDIHSSSSSSSSTTFTLATFLALFDDVTTWAIMAEDRNGRPGLSTHLSASFAGGSFASQQDIRQQEEAVGPGSPLDIIVQVTKIGSIFAFAQVQAVCAQTKNQICIGRHVKYLPSKKNMLHDVALGPLRPIVKLYASMAPMVSLSPSASNVDTKRKNMTSLISLTQETSNMGRPSRLTTEEECIMYSLQVSQDHCNPVGSFHGGCQAICMEQACDDYIRSVGIDVKENRNGMPSTLHLRSISMSYMSAGKGIVSFQPQLLQTSVNSQTLTLSARGSDGSNISEGILHYEYL